jgi:Fis family transcriptional regulator
LVVPESVNYPNELPTQERRKGPLAQCVKNALRIYFRELNGHNPANLHELVISQVEEPLLAVVMQHTGGNVTRAAQILGLNRGTLRKKLQKYHLD